MNFLDFFKYSSYISKFLLFRNVFFKFSFKYEGWSQ